MNSQSQDDFQKAPNALRDAFRGYFGTESKNKIPTTQERNLSAMANLSKDSLQKAQNALQEVFKYYMAILGLHYSGTPYASIVCYTQSEDGRDFTHNIRSPIGKSPHGNVYVFAELMSVNYLNHLQTASPERVRAANVFEHINPRYVPCQWKVNMPKGVSDHTLLNGLELLTQKVIKEIRMLVSKLEESTELIFHEVRFPG